MQRHFSTTIHFLAIVILLSLLAIPAPAFATGGGNDASASRASRASGRE